jgi:hypothetical protein
MAFMKTADAIVKNPSIHLREWEEVRQEATSEVFGSRQASVNLSEFSPAKYLLTHCTIIASVDVDEVSNVKTGSSVTEGNRTIKRLWNDYYITPETSKFINQNGDSWDRQTLLNTYRTFIGAENYVEHVQIPELSKGKIIDAVARDLGDTVYIDILVATDRKHSSLIQDIESGKMNAMSMGCSIQYSRCSKCGNVAADDTELCEHVRYEKGNTFVDESGKKRIVAELCGHSTDPDSVTFIEASWVANPAFKGAVMRTVLNPTVNEDGSVVMKESSPYAALFESSPLLQEFMTATNIDRYLHTASVDREKALGQLQSEMRQVFASASPKVAFGFEDDDEGGEDEDKNFVEEMREEIKDDLTKDIKRKIRQEVKEEMDLGQKKPEFKGEPEGESLNDTVVKSYQVFSSRYASELPGPDALRQVFLVLQAAKHKGWDSVKHSSSYGNREILAAHRIKNRDFSSEKYSPTVYACLSKVGGTRNYTNLKAFLNACELASGRPFSRKEARQLVLLGKVLK